MEIWALVISILSAIGTCVAAYFAFRANTPKIKVNVSKVSSFSIIKRKCKVKDFGTIMPGHGGVLDRFDSVIFTVPYVYLFLKFFPIIK